MDYLNIASYIFYAVLTYAVLYFLTSMTVHLYFLATSFFDGRMAAAIKTKEEEREALAEEHKKAERVKPELTPAQLEKRREQRRKKRSRAAKRKREEKKRMAMMTPNIALRYEKALQNRTSKTREGLEAREFIAKVKRLFPIGGAVAVGAADAALAGELEKEVPPAVKQLEGDSEDWLTAKEAARNYSDDDYEWMSSSDDSMNADWLSTDDALCEGTNPATGLPMCGGIDAAGNAYGMDSMDSIDSTYDDTFGSSFDDY